MIKILTDITLEIEGEGKDIFHIKVKKPSKKEQKQFKKFAKKQAEFHAPIEKALSAYRKQKRKVDELREEIVDISAIANSMDTEDSERTAYLKENLANRKKLRKEVDALEKTEETLNDHQQAFEEMQEETKREVFKMQVVVDDGLEAYIEESGIGYDIILEEIARLSKVAEEKK